MKILQIITLCELGGAQSVVINLADKFCKEHESHVASGEGDGKRAGYGAGEDEKKSIGHSKEPYLLSMIYALFSLFGIFIANTSLT